MNEFSLPLPIYQSVQVGELTSKDGSFFRIVAGLDKNLVGQLKVKSLDETDIDIQSHTSDRKRFGEGSYEEWHAKERTPFALVEDKTGTLAALAWIGPKPLGRKSLKYLSETELKEEANQKKGEWHTLVYRSYAPFRGKGLMTAFLIQVIGIYAQQYPTAKLWVGMSAENVASTALATKLGFKKEESLVDEKANWFAMTKEQ